MNKGIIKIFKLKIYIILILLITHKNIQMIYYIIFIYLITFIVKNLSKKRIGENMKHKEKDEKKEEKGLKETKRIYSLN